MASPNHPNARDWNTSCLGETTMVQNSRFMRRNLRSSHRAKVVQTGGEGPVQHAAYQKPTVAFPPHSRPWANGKNAA